jgi:hypothetical protein
VFPTETQLDSVKQRILFSVDDFHDSLLLQRMLTFKAYEPGWLMFNL